MRKLFCLTILLNLFFQVRSQTLVVPGDFPDPSVIKFNNEYWATATTSNWAPAYPLLMSEDLIHWETKGFVFPKLPAWADYYFWAPEISTENGKVYVYYTAHKRDGNLCVGIASADSPLGPYTDHGPVMCQEVGSIDAFPMRDENGKLFLIWKEDGNSVNKPTPIWAAELSEDRTKVIGEKRELFRNDVEWEANLVEGVSMVRQGEYFYAFYSGAGCCGRGCTYGIGVARSKTLMGPWEKYANNPIVISQGKWKCPGHGTAIEKDGKNFFLYHAYSKDENVYTGRQGVLSEFTFTADGWVMFRDVGIEEELTPTKVEDTFSGDTLSFDWQWSVFDTLNADLTNGVLELAASEQKSGMFIGQKALSTNFEAETVIKKRETTSEAGLGLVGDENNLIAATFKNNKIKIWKLEEGKETLIAEKEVRTDNLIRLKVKFDGPGKVSFAYAIKEKYSTVGPVIDGFFLPPWDRAIRIALMSKGKSSQKAVFDSFILKNKN